VSITIEDRPKTLKEGEMIDQLSKENCELKEELEKYKKLAKELAQENMDLVFGKEESI